MIIPQILTLPITNPPPAFDITPPSRFTTVDKVRLGNYSPFSLVITGIGNTPANAIVLPPFQQDVFTFPNARGNIHVVPQTIQGSGLTVPANQMLIAEFSDTPGEINGTYPAPLNGSTLTTVPISGAVTVGNTVTISGSVGITGTATISGSVSISGGVAVSGTVTVGNASLPVTGTVGVSGTVTTAGTSTVSGTVGISGTPTITGTVNTQPTAASILSTTQFVSLGVTYTTTVSNNANTRRIAIALRKNTTIRGTITVTVTGATSGFIYYTGSVKASGGAQPSLIDYFTTLPEVDSSLIVTMTGTDGLVNGSQMQIVMIGVTDTPTIQVAQPANVAPVPVTNYQALYPDQWYYGTPLGTGTGSQIFPASSLTTANYVFTTQYCNNATADRVLHCQDNGATSNWFPVHVPALSTVTINHGGFPINNLDMRCKNDSSTASDVFVFITFCLRPFPLASQIGNPNLYTP